MDQELADADPFHICHVHSPDGSTSARSDVMAAILNV